MTTPEDGGNKFLSMSFKALVAQIKVMCKTNTLNEETITGGLLGILFSSLSFLRSIQGASDQPLNSGCWWSSYRKNSAGVPEDTEKFSGADFAMLIALSPQDARLTIFQAKKATYQGSNHITIDISYEPGADPKTGAPSERQIFSLARTALTILDRKAGAGKSFAPKSRAHLQFVTDTSGAAFVHYLAYRTGEPWTMPLSEIFKLNAVKLANLELPASTKITTYAGNTEQSLTHLLLNGLTAEHKGWISLPLTVAVDVLPDLISLMPVVVGDGSGSFGLALEAHPDLARLFQSMEDAELLSELRDIIGSMTSDPQSSATNSAKDVVPGGEDAGLTSLDHKPTRHGL